jgi:hypothetical protein
VSLGEKSAIFGWHANMPKHLKWTGLLRLAGWDADCILVRNFKDVHRNRGPLPAVDSGGLVLNCFEKTKHLYGEINSVWCIEQIWTTTGVVAAIPRVSKEMGKNRENISK